METSFIAVDGYVATRKDKTNLRKDAWSFALDQRACGPPPTPRRVRQRARPLQGPRPHAATRPARAGARTLHRAPRSGAAAAVAFGDEPVAQGPPPPDLAVRFAFARSITASYGVHLVDWFACDDDLFRSSRLALDPEGEWWDVR